MFEIIHLKEYLGFTNDSFASLSYEFESSSHPSDVRSSLNDSSSSGCVYKVLNTASELQASASKQ